MELRRAFDDPNGGVETQNGGVEAKNEAVEGL
jgi:hypothetical protein